MLKEYKIVKQNCSGWHSILIKLYDQVIMIVQKVCNRSTIAVSSLLLDWNLETNSNRKFISLCNYKDKEAQNSTVYTISLTKNWHGTVCLFWYSINSGELYVEIAKFNMMYDMAKLIIDESFRCFTIKLVSNNWFY